MTHAIFSPSSSDRWIQCPASIPLTANMCASSNEHNFFTGSGTVCHSIAEIVLRTVFLDKGDYRPILDHACGNKWGYYADMPEELKNELVTSEMIEQVEIYLNNARDLIEEGDKVHIEKRVWHSEELFGTVDLLIERPGKLIVCDLKTGAGNIVTAWENSQLLTYAGLYLGDREDLPVVELVIIQPPVEDPVSTYTVSYLDVRKHMAKVERAMLQAETYNADALHSGPHCKWCPVRAACPELHRLASCAMSTNLDGLTPEKWAEVMDWAAILKPWCQSVYDRAHQLVEEEGLKIPGMKLVQRTGRKTWANEKEAEFAITEMLDDADVDLLETPDIWNPAKLKTPLQVQKALKDIVEEEDIEKLTVVPHRGTILVPESDKREEIDTTDHGKIAKSLNAFVNINSAN